MKDDETEWVFIGDAALGVWAAFNRENWKRRAAFALPESREETPKEGSQDEGPAPPCFGRQLTPANENGAAPRKTNGATPRRVRIIGTNPTDALVMRGRGAHDKGE